MIDRASLKEWFAIPPEELAERAKVPFEIVASPAALHEHVAQEMFDEIAGAAQAGREISIIVPIGPTGQYALLAERLNRERVSLRHVSYFGMDQCLDWQSRPLPSGHRWDFESTFWRGFLELVDPDLRPLPDNVIFPSALDLDRPAREIERRGGVATTYGGFGFQGHIAFNEPPSTRWSPVTLEELRDSRTRILPIAVDTIIAHSQRSLGGNTYGMPPMAVTLGMRELLGAKRVRLYTDTGSWKQTILRILLLAEPTVEYPVTLVQGHPDVKVVVDAASAASPPVDW